MQLYPHWLDGEYVRIATKSTGPQQNVDEMTRALKIHALLGTEFVLSDIQVFDSAAVLELFADHEFCKFVEKDRSFFDLRVDPDPVLGTHAFALAARGLARAQNQGWRSSVFYGDATPIKHLADEVIDEIQRERAVDPRRDSKTVMRHPAFGKQLNAVRQAVFYFGSHDEAKMLEAPIDKRWNYYEILHRTYAELGENIEKQSKSPDIDSESGRLWLQNAQIDLVNVSETILFIEKHVSPPDRRFRSQVQAILSKELDPIRRELFWNNVVQAWNYAIELTLQPDGGSVGNLPGAVSPAPYLESVTDVLVPVDLANRIEPMSGIKRLPVLQIDPGKISWKEVAKARAETGGTMKDLAHARASFPGEIELISEALRKHIIALGKVLAPPLEQPKLEYSLIIGKLVAGWFGSQTDAEKVVKVSEALGDLAVKAGPAYKQRQQRGSLISTLLKAAAPPPK